MGNLIFPLICTNDRIVQVGNVKIEASTLLAAGGIVALVAYIAVPIFKKHYNDCWLQGQETQ